MTWLPFDSDTITSEQIGVLDHLRTTLADSEGGSVAVTARDDNDLPVMFAIVYGLDGRDTGVCVLFDDETGETDHVVAVWDDGSSE